MMLSAMTSPRVGQKNAGLKKAWVNGRCLKCGNNRKEGHKRTCEVIVMRRRR